MLAVSVDGTYASWHGAARVLLQREVPPDRVAWRDARDPQLSLAGDDGGPGPPTKARTIAVPRVLVARARIAACHRDPERWALLYRLLWRATHGEREVVEDPLDADARRLASMVQQVRRDEHKMHAFVRFRKVTDAAGERYVAFHRPDHHIVERAAPFFVERFRIMRWSILTPDRCAHWDGESLTFSPGVDASAAPKGDDSEELWRVYYASVFNPARANPRAMIREMPVRHWATLPEARLIPALLSTAPQRVGAMLETPGSATSARPFVPGAPATLDELRLAAAACAGCELFGPATQTVFGEGPASARLMLVGEQPGDEEDRAGRPFVGPAGQVLADAIERAGLVRAELYVTNAVKHFTFRREGKRRLHERPRMTDVRACRPWLEAEIRQVRPAAIVCLGSTAAQTLLGPRVRIQRDRGTAMAASWAQYVIPTYHPSAVLRADDPAHSDEILAWLVEDLRTAHRLAVAAPAATPARP